MIKRLFFSSQREIMDPIRHWATDVLARDHVAIVQITYIHPDPCYILAFEVHWPTFRLPRRHHHRTTHARRFYLNDKCLNRCWSNRQMGPVFTPQFLPRENVRIGDFLLVDYQHTDRGFQATSYLPPSWSNVVVKFLQYYVAHARTRWMLESAETRAILWNELTIPFQRMTVSTFYHILIILITQDFQPIIDMLRFPRLRCSQKPTFDDQHQAGQLHNLHIPTTAHLVPELVLWAQDTDLLEKFSAQLQCELSCNSTNFMPAARQLVANCTKLKRYLARVIRAKRREI